MHAGPWRYLLALATYSLVALLAGATGSNSDDRGHAFLTDVGQAMAKMGAE